MTQTMIDIGIDVEAQHHEVATAGQCEIDMRFQPLVQMADNLMKYKYIIEERRLEARQDRHVHAQAAVWRQRFGMHTHFSLWKGGEPLFAGGAMPG